NASAFGEIEHAARLESAEHGLLPEVKRLHGVLCRALPKRSPEALEKALVELLVAMPVYRTYVIPGEAPPEQAVSVLAETARIARTRLDESLHADLDAVARLALGADLAEQPDVPEHAERGEQEDAAAEFVVRFQQTSAPLMAKGVEDTAFYRWSRLISLNEVG